MSTKVKSPGNGTGQRFSDLKLIHEIRENGEQSIWRGWKRKYRATGSRFNRDPDFTHAIFRALERTIKYLKSETYFITQ